MSIVSLTFQDASDIHVIVGQTSASLLIPKRLVVTRKKADDTVESIWGSSHSTPDEVITFKPLFKNTVVVIGTDTFLEGFGIRVDQRTGEVKVTGPLPVVRINNFILEVQGENTLLPAADAARKTTAFLRIHVHQTITKLWLTPSTLTVRQYEAVTDVPFPQRTIFKFSLRAQFDDDVVGDITGWEGISWTPTSRFILDLGDISIEAGDTVGSTFTVTASLPAALGGITTAPATVRIGSPWVGTSSQVDIVPGGGWPGIINPDKVPNVLFLCDGFGSGTVARESFTKYVGSLVHYLKHNPLNRPYDLLATSINFWCGFLPSDKKGSSVFGELYPVEEGTSKFGLYVPGPKKTPSGATPWQIEHVIYAVGLPLKSHKGKSIGSIRSEWTNTLITDPNTKIGDPLIEKWQKFAERSMVDSEDTPLAVTGGSPATGIKHNIISLDPNRMTRKVMDSYLGTLSASMGINLNQVWLLGSDKDNPLSKNFDLVCIIPATIGRAQNETGFFFVNPMGFDRIPIRNHSGTAAFQLDDTRITLPEAADDERGRLLAHELSHSFFLGDEYWDRDVASTETAATLDPRYSNLQDAKSILRDLKINGDEIKWNWHRISNAGVVKSIAPGGAANEWIVTLGLGHGYRFTKGDTVHFRFREYPKPLQKFPKISVPLVVKERTSEILSLQIKSPQTDAVYPAALTYPAASLVDPANFVSVFTEGSILYKPKPAPESVKTQVYAAEMVAKNIKTFITNNNRPLTDPAVSYPNGEEQQPNFDFSGVVGSPSLPDCFSRNRPRIVGLFEGGQLDRKNIFHPTGHCIMRDNITDGREFCAVCRYILTDIIDPTKHFQVDSYYDEIYPQR